jgi:hypothetical protein
VLNQLKLAAMRQEIGETHGTAFQAEGCSNVHVPAFQAKHGTRQHAVHVLKPFSHITPSSRDTTRHASNPLSVSGSSRGHCHFSVWMENSTEPSASEEPKIGVSNGKEWLVRLTTRLYQPIAEEAVRTNMFVVPNRILRFICFLCTCRWSRSSHSPSSAVRFVWFDGPVCPEPLGSAWVSPMILRGMSPFPQKKNHHAS